MHHIVMPKPEFTLRREAPVVALDMTHTALVVVDLQNFFLQPDAMNLDCARDIVPTVNALAASTRKNGGTVVFLRHTFAPDGPCVMPAWQLPDSEGRDALAVGLSKGASGHDIYPDLDLHTSDIVIDKYRASAFIAGSSNLNEILQGLGVHTLVVTGTMTNVCCESTARDAQMMNYRVLFVSDATATATDELHNAALLNLHYCFAEVVLAERVQELISGTASKQ